MILKPLSQRCDIPATGSGIGYTQVSLSITKGNPALRLYERLGFQTIDENEEDYIMLLKLK